MSTARLAPLVAFVGGLFFMLITLPAGGPFSGITDQACGPFCWADQTTHYVAAIAAMHEPIDWSQPLAISTLRYPIGTSLLLADALPIVSLPLRLIWQAGLEIDPALAMDLWVNGLALLAPLLIYRLACRLGSGPVAALASALLGTLLPGLIGWTYSGVQGLQSWPLVLLLIGSLLRDEEEPARRGGGTALIGALLWWASPYLGAPGAVLIALSALFGLFRRRTSGLVGLLGSLAGLALLRLADIHPPDGLRISSASGYTSSALEGLLSLRFEEFAQFASAEWGFWALLFFLVSLPFWWRRSPGLLSGALILGVLSLGSEPIVPGTAGGPFPSEWIAATPFADLRSIDRFFFIPALLGSLALPRIVGRELAGARLVGRLGSIALLVAAGLSVAVSGLYLYELQPSNRFVALVDERAFPALRSVVADHERLLFLPDAVCSDPVAPEEFVIAVWRSQGQANGIAWAGALEGVPAYSFYVGRMLLSSPIPHESAECDHVRTPPPPGTLVIVSTIVESISHPAPWREIVASLPYCSARIELGALRDVRFCSDRVTSIERFEAELRLIGRGE
jgi:hypothetical protein